MNSLTRQYLFGAIFIAFGIFQITKSDFVEFSLYILAGLAFMVNALTLEPKLIRFKKPLVIITWILIIAAAIMFLYVLRFKF